MYMYFGCGRRLTLYQPGYKASYLSSVNIKLKRIRNMMAKPLKPTKYVVCYSFYCNRCSIFLFCSSLSFCVHDLMVQNARGTLQRKKK